MENTEYRTTHCTITSFSLGYYHIFLFNTLNFLYFRLRDTVTIFVVQYKNVIFIIIQPDILIITVFGLITIHKNGINEQCKILFSHEYNCYPLEI
jgi:hypothetical protein